MILLDAYPLVAVLGGEASAAEVRELLRGDECSAVSLNVAETADVLGRRLGVPIELTRDLIGGLGIDIIDVGDRLAFSAASLRIRHYDRSNRAVSLADCCLVAAAQAEGATVATADPSVVAMARDERVSVYPLPDSSGVRPS